VPPASDDFGLGDTDSEDAFEVTTLIVVSGRRKALVVVAA
jgi:hypothetical protein